MLSFLLFSREKIVVVLVELMIVLINKFLIKLRLNSYVVIMLVKLEVISMFSVVSDSVGFNVIWKELVWVCILLLSKIIVSVRLFIM